MSDTTKDKKDPISRRQAAKTVLIGGGIFGVMGSESGEWIKPVIKNIALPVHARSTEPQPEPEPW